MRTLELIARIGGRLGLTLYFETDDRVSGQIVASDGRKFYFRNTRLIVQCLLIAVSRGRAATATR